MTSISLATLANSLLSSSSICWASPTLLVIRCRCRRQIMYWLFLQRVLSTGWQCIVECQWRRRHLSLSLLSFPLSRRQHLWTAFFSVLFLPAGQFVYTNDFFALFWAIFFLIYDLSLDCKSSLSCSKSILSLSPIPSSSSTLSTTDSFFSDSVKCGPLQLFWSSTIGKNVIFTSESSCSWAGVCSEEELLVCSALGSARDTKWHFYRTRVRSLFTLVTH